MDRNPLVSVLMPCWNSASTLPRALASLQAQTYRNWECILVDDGSTDNPDEVAAAAADPRVRYTRLDCNSGRGAARQTALDMATGDLLAMLDADDWIYPWKLEQQVRAMLHHPDLILVSAGMAIVDARDQLCGARTSAATGTPFIRGQMTQLTMPPVAFAPSMLITELARKTGFDSSYQVAEDVEFLLRYMFGRPYGILPDVTYVYTEHSSTTIAKVNGALKQTRRMFSSYRSRFPVRSRMRELATSGKQAIYQAGWHAGLWNVMISRRSANPSDAEKRDFHSAHHAVAPFERDIHDRMRADQTGGNSLEGQFCRTQTLTASASSRS